MAGFCLTLSLFSMPARAQEAAKPELKTSIQISAPGTPQHVQEQMNNRWEKFKENNPELGAKPTPVNLPSLSTNSSSAAKLAGGVKQVTSILPSLPVANSAWEDKGASALMDEIEQYKKIVVDAKKQVVKPDKRQFVELARNYVNRFTCSGKIETMVIPNDRGLEADILNDNHDLFLRVAPSDVRSFPVDISLVCDGNVYLMNGVVYPHIPSQEISLELPQGVRPISTKEKEKFQKGIQASEGLPLEEKLSLIMQRVYKDDLLPYWREVATPTSESRWTRGSYSVFLQKVVRTSINDLVAWDFVFRGTFPKTSIYDEVRKVVKGEIVAFGIVEYQDHGAARVIVTTKE